MDVVFCFDFYNTPSMRYVAFYATGVGLSLPDLYWKIEAAVDDLQKTYGFHRSSLLHCTLLEVPIIAYSSDLQDPTQQNQLMEAWRNVFLNAAPGCQVGGAGPLNITEDTLSRKIVRLSKEAYEEHRAQQLRARLHTHIDAVVPQRQPKKM